MAKTSDAWRNPRPFCTRYSASQFRNGPRIPNCSASNLMSEVPTDRPAELIGPEAAPALFRDVAGDRLYWPDVRIAVK
jgi:hypothetical protein